MNISMYRYLDVSNKKILAYSALSLCIIQKPRCKCQNNQITANKTRKNPQLLPPIIPTKPQVPKIPIPDTIRTISTRRRCIGIRHIPRRCFQKRSGVLKTRFSGRRFEDGKLVLRALDWKIVQFSGHHSRYKTGHGVEGVEPGAPEGGHAGTRDGDAAEETEGDHDRRIEETCDECIRGECCDHLSDGDCKKLKIREGFWGIYFVD
jgi:hypothetical protein